MNYDLQEIELAFFNHENKDSETSGEQWEALRKSWESFREYLDQAMLLAEHPRELKEGDIIWARDNERQAWQACCFKHIGDDGRIDLVGEKGGYRYYSQTNPNTGSHNTLNRFGQQI